MPLTSEQLALEKRELFELLRQFSFRRGDFVLASGRRSDYYMDCRMTTLSARGSYLIGRLLYDRLAPLNIDAVGGMSMGADPIVTAVTYRSAEAGDAAINGFLIRKSAKGHGTGRQVEGHLSPWMRVALVEDVVTTGGSTIQAIKAVRHAHPSVRIVKVLALVDREAGGAERFAELGVDYESLFTIRAFLSAS